MIKPVILRFLLLSIPVLCSAQVQRPGRTSFDFEQYELSNGIRTFLQPDTTVQDVSVEFWILSGIAHEERGKFGLAHFAEHATPYGLRSDTTARSLLRSFMTNSNAQTRKDYTRYFIQVKPEALELGLRYAAERFLADTLSITDEIVERHRVNVLAEIERNSSNALWGYKPAGLREAGTYGTMHPYGHAGYGTPAENKSFTNHDIRRWFDRHMVSENTVLFLVGNFRSENTKSIIRREFEKIPRRKKSDANVKAEIRQSDSRSTVASGSQLHMVTFTWGLPPAAMSDEAGLRLAASLIEEKLADTTRRPVSIVDAGSVRLMQRHKHAGQFGLYASFANLADTSRIENLFGSLVNDLLQSGVSERELARARKAEISRMNEMMEELGFIGSRTELLGEGWLFAGNPGHYSALLRRQSELSREELQSIMRKWLSAKPFVLIALASK